MPRFFVPRAELGENFLVLTGENAAHARVLRLKNGDAVTVCDGEGEEWHCVVSDVAPGQVSLVVQEHTAARARRPYSAVCIWPLPRQINLSM